MTSHNITILWERRYPDKRPLTSMTSHTISTHTMYNTSAGVDAMLNANEISDDRIAANEQIAVKAALGWSGWGSPVGLGILVVCVGLFLGCLHSAGILH